MAQPDDGQVRAAEVPHLRSGTDVNRSERTNELYLSKGPARRRSGPVLAVFGCIVAVQFLVGVLSIDIMSAVRAYVAGESLYSKGQKDAQLHLVNYADSHSEKDYRRFTTALAYPIGDRNAREALQRVDPDLAAARRGLLQGGTYDGDIPGVLRLFGWFQATPLMADALETWTEGDALIEQLRVLVERAHDKLGRGDINAPEVTELKARGAELNEKLTDLEVRFAAQLGDGARLSQRLLLLLNLALATLLGLTGLLFVRNSYRVQAATEDEVRRRQESLQRLLDSAAEGLYGIDTKGRCTFINKAALTMLGYEREADLLGQEMRGILRLEDDGRAREAANSRRAQHARELIFARKDGVKFEVEYWSHPIVEEGQVLGAVATFFDITSRKVLEAERRSMELALRQGEVHIAGVVDAVNDGVMTVNSEQTIVLFNRAAERLFGVPAEEAIGSNVTRLIPPRPPHVLSRRGDPRMNSLASSLGSVRDLTGMRADGQELALEASVSRMETDHGPLLTAVLRDATDLRAARTEREAREALESSNRAKTEFLSRMSHELRTPLNAVLGFSQLLRMDTADAPSSQQLVRIEQIESAGTHLLALVNDVLDLSRVDSGKMQVTLEPVQLDAAVDDAISMVLPLAASSRVKPVVSGMAGDLVSPLGAASPPDLWVLADQVRLKQVLVNLLTNAIKYNRLGGEVVVTWQASEERCEIRIADDGVGMSAEKLERLFEPFNRLGAEKSAIEGTGIGLVLTKRLVDLMGGQLRVESIVNRGTEVSVTLDRAESSVDREGKPSAPSQHGALDEVLRVLYAEDNETNVEIVKGVMRLRPSVDLQIAENGAMAFQKAKREIPHLMLVDMNLGDMNGLELAEALQSDPATSSIRLVALSADALPEQISAAMSSGFDGYLTKPIDFRALLNVIDKEITR